MFGKKKAVANKSGGTVLILDVESGSVASALVDLSKAQPHILAYQRKHLPLTQTRSGDTMTRALEQSLAHTLKHSAEVAARMRVHAPAQDLGRISRAVVFLAAPWGQPNLASGGPQFVPGIRQYIKEAVEAHFGDVPVAFYTSADALVYGSRAAERHIDTLTVSLRGELLELMLLNEAGPQAYGTVPLGSRTILRTLGAHGLLSEHEARSMLNLTKHTSDAPYEPLVAAGRHLSDSFAEGALLLLPAGMVTSVVVVAEQPLGEWFAKSIADNPTMADLFLEGTTAEALLPHHVAGMVGLGSVKDPFVLLEALFAGSTL